jgi:hypothetical protein
MHFLLAAAYCRGQHRGEDGSRCTALVTPRDAPRAEALTLDNRDTAARQRAQFRVWPGVAPGTQPVLAVAVAVAAVGEAAAGGAQFGEDLK